MTARRCHAVPVAVLLLVATACTPGPTTDAGAAPSLDDVPTVLSSYLDAISKRDTVALRAAFADDRPVPWIENGTVQYRGVDGVLQGLSQLPPGAPIDTQLADLEVMRIGDRGAHAWSNFTTSIGEGDAGYSFGGLISFLLEHDGERWKLVGGHVSAPVPR